MLKKILIIALIAFTATGCNRVQEDGTVKQEHSVFTDYTKESTIVKKDTDNTGTGLLPIERESIELGEVSPEHEYYDIIKQEHSDFTDYTKEFELYDQEIDDYFVIHYSLPPDYDATKEYPAVFLTDGVWRLSDHPEIRELMISGQMEDVILVSIGYPNGYDYEKIRERDFVKRPEDFLNFIVNNIVPYINEQYPLQQDNLTLMGHSYGGFFTFYALFNRDRIGEKTFKNYSVGSPFLQASTDKLEYVPDFEKQYYERNQTLDANVYVTIGGREEAFYTVGIEEFINQILLPRNYEGLNLVYEKIEGEEHVTVFKPVIKKTMLMYYGIEK